MKHLNDLKAMGTNCWGQDLIEYSLMLGFLAVAVAVVIPGISTSVSRIFSNVAAVCSQETGQVLDSRTE